MKNSQLMNNKLKILVKAPSRNRPFIFSRTISEYINLSTDKENISYMVTLDNNDKDLPAYKTVCERLNLPYRVAESGTKVKAINRDMDKASDFDILVLYSDDMICKVQGWDEILRNEMLEHFPDTDGVLWHNDGFTGKGADLSESAKRHGMNPLNTMVIIGKKYYERFNYLYHPDYHSLACDIEFMHVADRLNKQKYFSQVLFRHEHYSNSPQFNYTNDALMKHTQRFYKQDNELLARREKLNYGL